MMGSDGMIMNAVKHAVRLFLGLIAACSLTPSTPSPDFNSFNKSLNEEKGNTNAYIVERLTRTLATLEDHKKGKQYRLLLHAASPTSIQAEYWPRSRERESQSDFWHTTCPNTHLAECNETCLCRRCEYVRTNEQMEQMESH